jgi:lipopolysaccharide transport system ATP-binding protein
MSSSTLTPASAGAPARGDGLIEPKDAPRSGPVPSAVGPHGTPALASGTADEAVLECHHLGKLYHIYERPQDRLKQALLRPLRRQFYREFWALRGVTFEVRKGEAVGILGRNGAGKSTLLQIIAGTMAPTEGEVRVRGRVAAMLQLGSGFNPDFTGRENVFLAGSILGITRREMDERFDEVAAFADIGSFLDQPIKTYSSGMQARLAFAVSFSVQPDLLIVDEILAVGDIGFQSKCIARLRKMRDDGLTMLFVSHSPDAVRSTCQKGLFLDGGQPRYFGPAESATNAYLAHVREATNQEALAGEQSFLGGSVRFEREVPGQLRYGSGHVQIEHVEVLDAKGEPRRAFNLHDEVTIQATVRAKVDVDHVNISFLVRDMTGVDVMGTATCDELEKLPALRAGESLSVRFTFENRLRDGNYGVCLAVNRVTRRDYSDVVLFDQVDGVAAFAVMRSQDRPVHYKFHQPVAVKVDQPRAGATSGVAHTDGRPA